MEKPIMNTPRMVSLDQYLRQLSTLLCSKYVALLSVLLPFVLRFSAALSMSPFCLGFRILGLSFSAKSTSPFCFACATSVVPA
jgi:hypothetical protein